MNTSVLCFQTKHMKKNKYDIAISFANEDLNIALCMYLALKLKRKKGSVFYYKETFDNIGKSLKAELPKIYGKDAQFIVALISRNYLNKEKVYATIESNVIIQRWKDNPEKSFFIPLIIDDTPVSDIDSIFPSDIAYVRWNSNPELIAEKIWDMIEEEKEKRNDQIQSSKVVIDNSNANIKAKTLIQTGNHKGNINISG